MDNAEPNSDVQRTQFGGPLTGVRVIELAGIGPAPFCGMMLADMGADVVRIDRPGFLSPANPLTPEADLLNRSRRSAALDLKTPEGREAFLHLVDAADVVLEGFRPGVAERLGVGPDTCLRRNPRLVYGRMTGWGQDGPYAASAGHDINYIALAGALAPLGHPGEVPPPPLNLVGDFGGGGMLLAFGVVCALYESQRSGQGQVVDAAVLDGAALLTTMFHAMQSRGLWSDQRGSNLLDGGAPFYGTYACADGTFVSVGAIEPKFYCELVERLGLQDDPDFQGGQFDKQRWPARRARMAQTFRQRTRGEWCALLEHTDSCFAPVLTFAEAARHPHTAARGTFTEAFGMVQPAPAPRFGRSGVRRPSPPPVPGRHTREVLEEWRAPERSIEAVAPAPVRTGRKTDR
ncbi:CaiB/BaiF CoA-transferase family protein [Streptomyces flaveolus]|uniref:CaiB/BaiF CoA transferase family protein n=1 Tax=Streptomyces flaveolus TaxID=67297 RepID=UPI00342DC193